MSTADVSDRAVISALPLSSCSAARIRTWTIGTKIRGAAFTLRRKGGRRPTRTWWHAHQIGPAQPPPDGLTTRAIAATSVACRDGRRVDNLRLGQ